MHENYTLIVPRADRTGPTNVAVDIGKAAIKRGWRVRLLYLSGSPVREDLNGFAEVRRIKFSDLWRSRGVVHSHGLRPDLVAVLFRLFGGCVVLSTLHGHFPVHLRFDYNSHVLQATWWIWSRALRLLHHRVCISKSMMRFYQRQFPTIRFELAYNFRSPAAANSDTNAEIARWLSEQRQLARVVLIYVGSLNPRKNVRSLVGHVLKQPDLSLLVCGEGDELTSCAELVAQDHGKSVLLAGHVLNPESLIAKSDILILPSFAEGLPLVTVEAAHIGVPVLLSNLAVHRELVRLGLGEIFNHHDFHDLDAKARRLVRDRSPSSDAARREIWQSFFSPDRGFARYEDIIGMRTSVCSDH